MSNTPTYAFADDGKVAAFHGDRVIATGDDFTKVAEVTEEYFNALHNEQEHQERKTATHITTPNGDTGVILGRTASIFSDSITVRFENGQIRHYDTFVGDGIKFSKEASDLPKSPVEYFKRQLEEAYTPGREGLTTRLNTLEHIKRDASHLASQGVSYADGQALHQIVLAAAAERNEVGEALEHLAAADAEAMTAPKMAYQAVEQADLGRTDSWLEVVANEMIAESESQDFDKLLTDGPVTLVSNMDDAAIANAGIVREAAVDHVIERTAGFAGPEVEQYRDQFVANAELARRREASYRRDMVHQKTAQKEASVADVSDEALFL